MAQCLSQINKICLGRVLYISFNITFLRSNFVSITVQENQCLAYRKISVFVSQQFLYVLVFMHLEKSMN